MSDSGQDRPTSRKGSARSLYIHVPFCFHKCHYCDFYSIVDTRDRQGVFVERLSRELAAIAPWAARLSTIFVGGGTPSLLRVELWKQLLGTLDEQFDLSAMRQGGGEFTVECNPETVTTGLMDVLVAGGVNRVSMGAQSFESRHLKTLERWHSPENVARALELARAAGLARQNVDLIFGIPGQTVPEWEADLKTALDLGTTHLSCYNLTYEPNTAMTARLKRGEFAPADEDTEVDMYEATLRITRARGLERYEVSNYAAPGEECRHNLAYWRGEDWLAAGPSASGHIAGNRWKNSPRLDDYLTLDDRGFAGIVDWEKPNPRRALRERIMTGLRLHEGIDKAWLLDAVASVDGNSGLLRVRMEEMRARALGETVDGRFRLTDAGMLLADELAGQIMDAVGD
jgi:oxygen-independent coproporphyrinogen III oxidase